MHPRVLLCEDGTSCHSAADEYETESDALHSNQNSICPAFCQQQTVSCPLHKLHVYCTFDGCKLRAPKVLCGLTSFSTFFARRGDASTFSGVGRSAGFALISLRSIFANVVENPGNRLSPPCLKFWYACPPAWQTPRTAWLSVSR